MQSSVWAYLFLVLGLIGIVLINLFGNITVSNEDMYYILKEVTEASMIDAVDYQAYRVGVGYDGVTIDSDSDSMHCISGIPGTIRIVKEKFVESFVRRFSSTATANRDYEIRFEDIDECPPKVSVTIIAKEPYSLLSNVLGKSDKVNYETDSAEVVNTLSAILEDEFRDEEMK